MSDSYDPRLDESFFGWTVDPYFGEDLRLPLPPTEEFPLVEREFYDEDGEKVRGLVPPYCGALGRMATDWDAGEFRVVLFNGDSVRCTDANGISMSVLDDDLPEGWKEVVKKVVAMVNERVPDAMVRVQGRDETFQALE